MSKRGLPAEVKMRHDVHYVDELVKSSRSFGRIIPTERIEPNPEQPRTEIGDLTELANSIREKGVLEPLLVKPQTDGRKWLIIAGERRWRAAQLAGLTEVPCVELNINDREVAEIALIENLQRKDLTIWEEADALAALCRRYEYTHEELAGKIGKSRSSITESLSIANLPQTIRERCAQAGISSKSQALQIARQFDENAMLAALERRSENLNGSAQTKTKQNDRQTSNLNSTEDFSTGIFLHQPQNEPIRRDELKNNYPVRIFAFRQHQNEFKLEIKFKKPADKSKIIEALKETIEKIENTENMEKSAN